MSISVDGRRISCDGPDCVAVVPAPVGSRAEIYGGDRSERDNATQGWLFVLNGRQVRHYCPNCHKAYLEQISSDASQL